MVKKIISFIRDLWSLPKEYARLQYDISQTIIRCMLNSRKGPNGDER